MPATATPFPINRSMPESAVVPVLHYRDVPQAVAWLCSAFGFSERLRIGDHRVQLNVCDGAGAVVAAQAATASSVLGNPGHSVMVRVRDVDAHFGVAKRAGAEVLGPPQTHPYGERQYSAVDPAGHVWTFSQTVADVDPESWGGTLVGGDDAS